MDPMTMILGAVALVALILGLVLFDVDHHASDAALAPLFTAYRDGLAAAKALTAKADSELTAEERTRLETLIGDENVEGSLKSIQSKITKRRDALKAVTEADGWGRDIPPGAIGHGGGPSGHAGRDRGQGDRLPPSQDVPETTREVIKALTIEFGPSEIDKTYPTGGYKSLGHFCYDVMRAGRGNFESMKALNEWHGLASKVIAAFDEDATKAATGHGIRLDDLADWFVPIEFSSSVYARMTEAESNLFAKVRRQTIRGNKIKLYAEDDADRNLVSSRHGGVTVHWLDEGDPIPASKVDKGRFINFDLHKVAAMVYLTNELIEDSERAVDQYINERVDGAIAWEVSRQIYEGVGGGLPLGAFNERNKSLIVIEKEAGQPAGTITERNFHLMFSRMHVAHLPRAVWHLNLEVWPELWALNREIGTGGVPIYMPPGGLSASPYGSILGRPVEPLEFNHGLGEQNDINFVDWNAYQVVFKGQTRRDISMHAEFVTDQTAIRFVFRMDGKPLWNKPMTPFRGTRKSSPFVTLGARA